MEDYPTLAWRVNDLPEQLRWADVKAQKAAKAIYNARLLAGLPGDPIEETIADLRRRGIGGD